ncbi:MAG: hypothetical protein U9N45_02800 [Gemmatimonadota bacterium]|nr:hypothetical protein [Gemmatimonadota bacterium]
MKITSIFLSILGLVLTVAPSLLVFCGALSWKAHVQLMTAGMILWFLFAPVWIAGKRAV